MLRRKITDELVSWKSAGAKECLLIKGARQVGKTFAVRRFAEDNYENFVMIDFVKNPEMCRLFDGPLDMNTLIQNMTSHIPGIRMIPGRTLIFFDEIQQCPKARSALKYLAEDGRFDTVASGSLLGINLKNTDFIPVGYEREIHMRQLDFEEFLWAIGLDGRIIDEIKRRISEKEPLGDELLEDMNRYFRMYTVVGGMPEAVQTFTDSRDYNAVRSVHGKILNSYREDIAKYAKRTEVLKINSCLESVKEQLGRRNKKFKYSEIEPEKGYSVGAEFYSYALYWLTASDIVLMTTAVTEPHRPLEERLDKKRFKLYMRDTGILISMYSRDILPAILDGDIGVNKGAVTENAVISMIEQSGRPLLYYEKMDTPRMEIDAVITVKGEVTAAEIKSGNNRRSVSLNRFMDTYDLKGIRFENKDIFTDELGITHYPLFAAAFINEIDPEIPVTDDTDIEADNERILRLIGEK